MEQIFSSADFPCREGLLRLANIARREFFDGELAVGDPDDFDIRMDRVLRGPVPIIHILSRSRISFRRDSLHVRRKKVGLKVLWLVRAGSATIHYPDGFIEIGENQIGIVDADTPFRVVYAPGPDGCHDAFQTGIPARIFDTHFKEVGPFTEPFDLAGPHGDVMARMLALISRHGDRLQVATSNGLVFTMLDAIADHLRERRFEALKSKNIPQTRLAEIESFIAMHASDPDISLTVVAESLGISPRYIGYLLKSRNTNFSEMLWRIRLSRARAWLASSEMLSIGEIAFLTGFKCVSHFSRKFRQAYRCSPRQYRGLSLAR